VSPENPAFSTTRQPSGTVGWLLQRIDDRNGNNCQRARETAEI
jgi:hypothetical protein